MSADLVLTAARACINTPFRHQGRLPGRALDCAGLVVQVAQAIGAEYLDQSGYSRSPQNGLLEDALDRQPCMERIRQTGTRQPGDILLMRFAGDPQHLAIDAGQTIIHAYAQAGKVCEHAMSDDWVHRIVRVYRFKGGA